MFLNEGLKLFYGCYKTCTDPFLENPLEAWVDNQDGRHLVFDLDDTLIFRDYVNNEPDLIKYLRKKLPNNFSSFLHENKDVFVFLLPGAAELIQWLNENDQVQLHFYSAGVAKANFPTVKALLNKAKISQEKIDDLLENEKFIFSRENLINNKKDLSCITGKVNQSILLIDDQITVPETQYAHLFQHSQYIRNKLYPYGKLKSNFALDQVFFITGVLSELLKKDTPLICNTLEAFIYQHNLQNQYMYEHFCRQGFEILKIYNPDLTLPELTSDMENFMCDEPNSEPLAQINDPRMHQQRGFSMTAGGY